MTAEDIERLLASAPPGTVIDFVSIRLPKPGEIPTAVVTAGERTGGDEDEWTPATIVEWVRGNYGEEGLKPKNWAALLQRMGISASELERGVRTGAIRSRRKADGKDHGAYLIPPDEMLAYLRGRPAGSRRSCGRVRQ